MRNKNCFAGYPLVEEETSGEIKKRSAHGLFQVNFPFIE
jgi:hypothetical protein